MEHPEAQKKWDHGSRRDGSATAGPELVQPAAGVAGGANRCPIAHRVLADPAVSAAVHHARHHDAHGLPGHGRLLDRRDRVAGRAGQHASTAVSPAPAEDVGVHVAQLSRSIGTLLLGIALAGVAVVIFDTVAGQDRPPGSPAACTLVGAAASGIVVPLPGTQRHKTTPTRVCVPRWPGNSGRMLIRRIARPMLSAVFISRGVDALRSPKPAADAARPTLEGLSKLPDPVGTNVPSNAETVARVNAAVQIGGGLLLATGKLPRAGVGGARTQRGAGKPWRTYILERDPIRSARPTNVARSSPTSA